MQLPFRHIALLVIVSLSGIFGYQAYWLADMYKTEKAKANIAIENAIKDADHIELFIRVDSVSEENEKKRKVITEAGGEKLNSISYSISFKKEESPDSVTATLSKKVEEMLDEDETIKHTGLPNNVKVGDGYHSLVLMAEQLQKGLHSAVDLEIGGIDLNRFDSVLNSELQKAQLNIQHYTQIVHLKNDSIINSTLPHDVNPERLSRYEHIYDIYNEYAYYIYTEPISRVILRQMSGILISSFIILVILGFSFWFLIHILMKQRSLDEMKSDFTNNITHELKTPIAVAYAANDALLNFSQAEDKAKRDKYLKIAQEQLQKLSGLVEQILSMSMEQRKTFKLYMEEVQMAPLLQKITEQHKLKADKTIHISIDPEQSDIKLVTDRAHLSNVISNLIDNAIKYSTDTARITIRYQMESGKLKLSVKDKGIGIPKEKIKHLFDKFYRIPTGNLHNVKGYGLGLFYVKTILDKLGGRITVESEIKKGTTFTIYV